MNYRFFAGQTIACLSILAFSASNLFAEVSKKEVEAKVKEQLPSVLAKIDSEIEKAIANLKHEIGVTPFEIGIETNRYSIKPGGRLRGPKLVQMVSDGCVETLNVLSGNEWYTDKSKPGWRSCGWKFVPVKKNDIADVEKVIVALMMKVAKHLESRKIEYQSCYESRTTNPQSSTVGDAATAKICLSW